MKVVFFQAQGGKNKLNRIAKSYDKVKKMYPGASRRKYN